MRLGWSLTVLAWGLLALPALAQPPEGPEGDGPPPSDPAMKQKLLDAFDTNKDGTIDRAEAREIGRGLRENFGIGPGPGRRGREGSRGPDGPPRGGPRFDGPPPGGPPPGDEGPERGARRGPEDRDPQGRGPEGRRRAGRPDGPPRPPNPERLFNAFDEDKNESLSKEEFKKLTDVMRELRPMGPPMAWRGGPGFDRRGPDGPPRGDFERRGEGRRRGWWRERPPGPPPGPDGPPPPADDPPPASDAPPEDPI